MNKNKESENFEMYEALMTHLKPYGDYDVSDYYGVSLMKIKKNNKFSIRLIYDYKKHSLTSSQLEIDDLETAINVYRVLESFTKDKSEKIMMNDVMKIISDNKKNAEIKKNVDIWE